MDIIDMQSFQAGYAAGYAEGHEKAYEDGYYDGRRSHRNQMNARRQKKRLRNKRFLYFTRQKIVGILMLLFTILSVKILDGDISIGLITIPVGLMLIFSKEPILTCRYYWGDKGNK